VSDFILLVGDKNQSTWSVRAWLALRQTGADFTEETIPVDTLPGQFALTQRSPSRRVPVLQHGDLRVWDSLAIVEYLAELFPGAGLWPRERAARSLARAACAEMHSGFEALRKLMPMNVRAANLAPASEAAAEIKRLLTLWRGFRDEHADDGPFLFGEWSAADAFFAPVVSRFFTYGVAMDQTCQAYAEAVIRWPTVIEWMESVRLEK